MTPQHSTGTGPLTAQELEKLAESHPHCEECIPMLRVGLEMFDWSKLADALNARLAAAPTGQDPIIDDGFGNQWSERCPECGELTMSVVRPGKVQCDNPKGCPPQDLARLEALVIRALNATVYEYGDFAPECGSHSSTWVKRFTVELDSELTLLRKQ